MLGFIDLSEVLRSGNIFLFIFAIAVYFHGLFIASFFIAYNLKNIQDLSKNIRTFWKIIFTFLLYQIALYIILSGIKFILPGDNADVGLVVQGLVPITLMEFFLIFIIGIIYSLKLERERLKKDPYWKFKEGL